MFQLHRFLPYCLLSIYPFLTAPSGHATPREEVDLTGTGWKLIRDQNAAWKSEEIYLPGTPLASIAIHPPSAGWESIKGSSALDISVPGTTEQYFHKDLDLTKIVKPRHPNSPLEGVTWWSRSLKIPEVSGPHRFMLRFGSIRLRAEVFINQHLVGYDLVGDTPFAVDITDVVQPGQTAELAVRVTNPGGCLDWTDTEQIKWGTHVLPDGRSFSGITGSVSLQVLNPAYIEDLSIANTPDIHRVVPLLELVNTTSQTTTQDICFEIIDPEAPHHVLLSKTLTGVTLPPGPSQQSVKLTVPEAKIWSPSTPHLYICRARLTEAGSGKTSDGTETPFGFRTFTLDGLGKNALLRLNGERIFLRTAISWGYWPETGLIPTPHMAQKQVKIARDLGLNMLNFHRCIGSPVVFNEADRQGLLYFEEPGGYVTGGADPFAQALAREKLLRMVKRDRSHPSLIIYNLINEQWDAFGADKNPSVYANAQRDMKDAHALDPSRLIVYSSAWDRQGNGADEIQKLNMRPYDDVQYSHGWWDFHRAGGPATYQETTYSNPSHHYGYTDNKGEIVYWGEEGAISSPPRLALIKKDIDAGIGLGWDRETYLNWYQKFDDFMNRKKLHAEFGSLDDFTLALGKVSFEHQGRKIEDTRICDLNDGYAINGWEAMVFDNHSGVVDCYRNPKGDPDLIAHYTQPLYIAIKLRHQFAEPGHDVLGDIYLLNEGKIKGNYTLKYSVVDASGKKLLQEVKSVAISGGDIFSELLAEGVALPAATSSGFCRVKAQLMDTHGEVAASGNDEFLTVDWKNPQLPRNGAVFEYSHDVRDFLAQENLNVPAYDDSQGQLQWLLVARSLKDEAILIPTHNLTDIGDREGQVTTTFFQGDQFQEKLGQRSDKTINFNVSAGATPDPGMSQIQNYGVRMEGKIVPIHSGTYHLVLKNNQTARLYLDNKLVLENKVEKGSKQKEVSLELVEGRPVPFHLDYVQGQGDASFQLMWLPPSQTRIDLAHCLERVKSGTTLILADHAEDWMETIKAATGIAYTGSFKVGTVWLGGQFFVRKNDLFRDLPTNCALNWPYQAVVDDHRIGFALDGEQLVAGCWQSTGCQLGTAVGIIPYGKGRIIFSTLNIVPKLSQVDPPSLVAKKLLNNYIAYPASSDSIK